MTPLLWVGALVLALVALSVRVRVHHTVLRRAEDPPELQDGECHWVVEVWTPLVRARRGVATMGRRRRPR